MSQETRTFKRAHVTKILIAEAVRTTHDLPRGEGQYEAQTYRTPTGRIISKVMIAGVAVEKEDVGKDQSMWRLRVSDPSGAMHVYAGTYQPEAAQVIAQLEIPAFVAVVGKLNLYKPEAEDGNVIVSIRPDSVTLIDGVARDNLILDASLSTLKSLRKTTDETRKEIANIYGEKDGKEAYILVARQAIESLEPISEKIHSAPAQVHDETGEATPEEKPVAKAPSSPPPPQASAPAYPGKADKKKEKEKEKRKELDKTGIDDAIQTVQEVILGLLQEKGTIKYQDIPDLLKERGVNPNMVDWTSAVKRLMQEGMCCEPRLGTLRVV
jgi:RPA family protein